MRDGISAVLPVGATVAGASPATGVIIDRKGYDSASWFILLAAAGQPTYTMHDGDAANLSDAAAVDASLILQDAYGAGSTVHKVGYLGNKRYVRLYHTGTGTCICLLARGERQPV